VQFPYEQNGLSGSAIIIDTENNFKHEIIVRIVDSLSEQNKAKYYPEDFLKNIHVAKAYNSNHQILLVDTATELANKLKDSDKPVRLLVIDSLTALFMTEYMGRGALADRQQKLNKHMHDLMNFANIFNAAIVVINDVSKKDPKQPIGGHIITHNATFILYVQKSKGKYRIARLVDSPNLRKGEAIFPIID
jgi:DNA repair protein RadA